MNLEVFLDVLGDIIVGFAVLLPLFIMIYQLWEDWRFDNYLETKQEQNTCYDNINSYNIQKVKVTVVFDFGDEDDCSACLFNLIDLMYLLSNKHSCEFFKFRIIAISERNDWNLECLDFSDCDTVGQCFRYLISLDID